MPLRYPMVTSYLDGAIRAMPQWSNFGFRENDGLRVGYGWAISGLHSKTPTLGWRLLTG